MKKGILIFATCASTLFCAAQKKNVDSVQVSHINPMNLDSLTNLLETASEDTTKANILGILSYEFAFIQADQSVMYGQQGVQLSQKLGYRKGIAFCTQSLAMGLWGIGNYRDALQTSLTALHLYEELKDFGNIAFTYYILANIYRDFGDYKRALEEARKGFKIYKALGANDMIGHAIIGSIYDLHDQVDSASYYVQRAIELNDRISNEKFPWLNYLQGNIYRKQKQYDSAMYFYLMALPVVQNKDLIETYNGIALLYDEIGKIDSSIYYASQVLQKWKYVSYQRGILQSASILADAYKKSNQRDSAIKYFELSVALHNKMFNQQNEREIQNIAFNEQLRVSEEIRAREEYQNTLKMYAIVGAGLFFLAIASLLWRNNQHKKKANLLLLQQKGQLEKTLQELKATQSQLIQSEKMASLGQLTAGIAHEIQNPLNFVNNFSEVSNELIEEIEEERDKNQESRDEKLIGEILTDVKENLGKITLHGKRADAIVKGMLAHSRASSGEKIPTDINALADEFIRLSYHGMRAKDKSFNAEYKTDFDPNLPKVNVVPQDIGRVLLNIINNAFQACAERLALSKAEVSRSACIEQGKRDKGIATGAQVVPNPYSPIPDSPLVKISTKNLGDKIQISISDNGSGIPDSIKDKIFQPFFTTKPTGEGTGLGLSLSYDIVKAHGGELKVESQEGKGSEFIIKLPIV